MRTLDFNPEAFEWVLKKLWIIFLVWGILLGGSYI